MTASHFVTFVTFVTLSWFGFVTLFGLVQDFFQALCPGCLSDKPEAIKVCRQRIDDGAAVAIELGQGCGVLSILGVESEYPLDGAIHLRDKHGIGGYDLGLQSSR